MLWSMPIVSLESTQLRNSVNISEADKETSSPKSFHVWSEAVNDRDEAPSGLLDYPADTINEIEHFKSMLSTEFNISDRMEFYDTNIIPQYPVDLDLGDFDDLSHSVQAIFNDFGTKYKSEILNDQYTYEYYVYKSKFSGFHSSTFLQGVEYPSNYFCHKKKPFPLFSKDYQPK